MPLLNLEVDQYIPCALHLFMGIMRLLINQLVEKTCSSSDLATQLELVITQAPIKIKLPQKSKKKETMYDFVKKIEKARLQRPDFIRILQHYKLILTCYNKYAKTTKGTLCMHITQTVS